MTYRESALSAEQANTIYGALVAHAGAPADGRAIFVSTQTRQFITEYRFCGLLGSGGKFWRTTGRRADGTWGEVWLINGYPEDVTGNTGRESTITVTNAILAELQQRHLDSQ